MAIVINGSGTVSGLTENIGIGIASPLDILHLNDSDDDCVINLDTAQANKNSIVKFSDPDAQGRGFIQYNHTTDSLRTTVAGTERTRIHSDGVLSVPAGVALGVAASSNNGDNVLNDYEEGTHEPTIVCSTSGSYTIDTGANVFAYTKIGRVVHIQGGISTSGESSPNGNLRMSLPFTPFTGTKDTDYSLGNCAIDAHGGTIDNAVHIFVFGANYAQFATVADNGSFTYIDHDDVDTAFAIKFSFSYITDA